MAEHQPDWAAPVLVSYALAPFKRKESLYVAGLWLLGREAQHLQLAPLALPNFLRAIPLRATRAMRDEES